MLRNKRELGSKYEDIASEYLRRSGYIILERNFSCRDGEIDIITKKNNLICFVEVKYRSSMKYGMPSEAVDIRKQQKIIRTANYYIIKNHLSYDNMYRFDVVSILGNRIDMIENAFGGI